MSLLVAGMLSTVTAAVFMLNMAHGSEVAAIGNRTKAMYMAASGVSEGILQIATCRNTLQTLPANLGTSNAPVHRSGGSYWAGLQENADGTYTVTSTGAANLARRKLQVVVAPSGSVFDHAVFAGNKSGDPDYALEFGGTGAEADDVIGDIYSGGDVVITGDAAVTGGIDAGGTITGGTGTEFAARDIPDIAAMDYAINNDFDVAALFAAGEVWAADDAGGSAWQMAEDSPAHIFRKNPNDRSSECNGTTKDDYFLEDPYETVRNDPTFDGSDAYEITFSGSMGKPGPDGTNAVYYIDGNLWVHSHPTYSFKFMNDPGEAVHVTFVVKGNITFSDNLFYHDKAIDGVAFIAIEDEDEPDSGNIRFGDPSGGTLEYMDAYMYAENDFLDINMSADGSKEVTVNGTMSAGNQVAIERDYAGHHSKLTVEYDERIATGALDLPGLPSGGGADATNLKVVFWRELTEEAATLAAAN